MANLRGGAQLEWRSGEAVLRRRRRHRLVRHRPEAAVVTAGSMAARGHHHRTGRGAVSGRGAGQRAVAGGGRLPQEALGEAGLGRAAEHGVGREARPGARWRVCNRCNESISEAAPKTMQFQRRAAKHRVWREARPGARRHAHEMKGSSDRDAFDRVDVSILAGRVYEVWLSPPRCAPSASWSSQQDARNASCLAKCSQTLGLTQSTTLQSPYSLFPAALQHQAR